MGRGTRDVGRAVELLSIAATAVQIHKLALETKPPAGMSSVLAGDIAEDALKRARGLLRKAGGDASKEPGGTV